jgi:hypothetical protein
LENSQRHHSAADASVYLVNINIKRQIYYAHHQKKNVLNQITYPVCTQNWVHFLHFSENSQRHHSATDASVYLLNIKRQIYYAHHQKKKCSESNNIYSMYAKLGTLFPFSGKLSAASFCR